MNCCRGINSTLYFDSYFLNGNAVLAHIVRHMAKLPMLNTTQKFVSLTNLTDFMIKCTETVSHGKQLTIQLN